MEEGDQVKVAIIEGYLGVQESQRSKVGRTLGVRNMMKGRGSGPPLSSRSVAALDRPTLSPVP